MIQTPQLCLGTVQFGLSYGITNQTGHVSEEEVRQILNLAVSSGINLFDTAHAYGNAEKVLGSCLPAVTSRRIISKLPARAPVQSWEESLITSLQRLKVPKLHGLLLHRSSDLIEHYGKALLDWLESLRDRGLVDRIGISIYDSSELEGLPLDRMQMVQLPLSIYDQRLIRDGTVSYLHERGISVHVRSVLLQGLLLQSPQQWPDYLSQELRAHHTQWLEHLQLRGISPLAGALEFIRLCEGVEAVVFGVTSRQELAQVLQAWEDKKTIPPEAQQKWAWKNVNDLDPRLWPSR